MMTHWKGQADVNCFCLLVRHLKGQADLNWCLMSDILDILIFYFLYIQQGHYLEEENEK